jgi:hypothetical protein
MSEGALIFEQVTLQNGLCGMVTASYRMLEVEYNNFVLTTWGTRGSVVVKALCYKPEGRSSISDEVNLEIYLIIPASLGPGVYSASNRNEYQKHKNNNVYGKYSAVGA